MPRRESRPFCQQDSKLLNGSWKETLTLLTLGTSSCNALILAAILSLRNCAKNKNIIDNNYRNKKLALRERTRSAHCEITSNGHT